MSVLNDRLCVVLGAGGHARVVIEAIQSTGVATPHAILDIDPALHGKTIYGVPILGADDLLPELIATGVEYFVVGLGGVADNKPRAGLFDRAVAAGLKPLCVVHDARAYVSPNCSIGPGSVVFPGAIVNAGTVLGSNVIVNSGALIEHDCVVGDHVHVSSASTLCGTVRVGKLAHIGAGAVVRQSVTIGEGAVVGAGAVVTHDVESWRTVMGVPAR
ncbi:MAG TPA: acetyltransferase [Terriglobia bacterium]|nr:acetyltransferase [Terriglobia bacterium]